MTVLEIGLGVGLALSLIWGFIIYLMQIIRIEELEDKVGRCGKSAKKNR